MKKVTAYAVLALVLLLAVTVDAVGMEAPGLMVNDTIETSRLGPSEGVVIRAIFDRYAACVQNYDADGWMALWDENGVQLPPGFPMRVGKEAIRTARYTALLDRTYCRIMNIDVEEIVSFPSEGYAIARGVYTSTSTPQAGGAASFVDGKFMTIFRRQADGSWLIYRDIFNSNR